MTKLSRLMYGLIYPAIVGALIVAFFENLQHLNAFGIWAAIFIIVYFCTQFLEGESPSIQWPRFLVDILEILLVYQLMVSLDIAQPLFFYPDWIPTVLQTQGIQQYFVALSVALLIPPIHRLFRREICEKIRRTFLSLVAAFSSLLAAIHILPMCVALLICYICVSVYIFLILCKE